MNCFCIERLKVIDNKNTNVCALFSADRHFYLFLVIHGNHKNPLQTLS